MKAVTFQGVKDVQVKDMPAPVIQHNDDVIIKVTSTAICGSDLHLLHGMTGRINPQFIVGHEPVGVVEDVGPAVAKIKPGDRVVIPISMAFNTCVDCNAGGGQAEYARVPMGDENVFPVPKSCTLEDDQLIFLSDLGPTAYRAVEHAGVQPGQTVIVLGCGPVGLLVQKFVWLKGAKRVIAVDSIEYRLAHAHVHNQVETFNFASDEDPGVRLWEMTKGGADVVIDCVGMGATQTHLAHVRAALRRERGNIQALRTASKAVRSGGTIQIVGLYHDTYHAFPLGDLYDRKVTLRIGLQSDTSDIPVVLHMMETGQLHPTDMITHRLPLADAKHAYEVFDVKLENCIKVILRP